MNILDILNKSNKNGEDDSKESKPKKVAESGITSEKKVTKKTSEEDLAQYGFKIGRVLGEGSYSAVRFATYKEKEIAVKIINRERISQDFTSKFLPREIEVLSKVKHKNIIHVFKIFNYPRKVYIFMEYMPRGDLLSYVRSKGSLSEKKTRRYFKQMVAALQYLHGLNIAHRDLKCENIMLSDDDNIRIIDFGFCRSTVTSSGRRILSQTYCGSTAYAAPEVLQGTPYNPMMYDVWSLGCVLFIMVAGSMPFDDSNVKKMVEHQLKRKLKFPRGLTISSAIKELIKNMLEPDVTKRVSMERLNSNKWVTKDDEKFKKKETSQTKVHDLTKTKSPEKK